MTNRRDRRSVYEWVIPSDGAYGISIMESFSNYQNIILGKLGATMILALRMFTALLVFHVQHIVMLRTKKKMQRINAKAVIATVAYAIVGWILPIEQKPRGAVSKPRFAGNPYRPIATVTANCAIPDPAVRGGILNTNFGHKSGLRRFYIETMMATPTHGALYAQE